MGKSNNRNATASWSGFSHQGQVGLLLALIELQNPVVDKENTFLQYENREDVAIYSLDNGKPVYESVHQVKAYYSKGTKMNDYPEVFKGKMIYEKDDNGKFIKEDGKKIFTGNYESGQWCGKKNFLHTVQEITNWDKSKAKTEDDPPVFIERYEYPNGQKFCNNIEIDGLILEQLNKIFDRDSGRAGSALKRLTYKLDEKIRNEHKIKKSKKEYNIEFSLNEIEEIINDNDDYFVQAIFECRKLFYELFIEMIDSSEIDEKHEKELIDNVILPIYQKDDLDFFRFLQNLNLNESEKDLESSHVAFNKPGLEQVFYELLFAIVNKTPTLTDDNFIQYDCKSYRLTSIIDEEKKGPRIVKNIIQNLDCQNIFWEKTSLINKEINRRFQDLNPDFFDTRNKEEKAEDFNKFMNYNGSTSFICRETAKTNLENE